MVIKNAPVVGDRRGRRNEQQNHTRPPSPPSTSLVDASLDLAEQTRIAEERFLSACAAFPVEGHDLCVRHEISSHTFAYGLHGAFFALLMGSVAEHGIRPGLKCMQRLLRDVGFNVPDYVLGEIWYAYPLFPTDYEALQVKHFADRRDKLNYHLKQIGDLLGDYDVSLTPKEKRHGRHDNPTSANGRHFSRTTGTNGGALAHAG